MVRFGSSAVVAGLVTAGLASAEAYTPLHEAGRCAIRGQCGKKSFFGKELPCPDNGLAKQPEDAVREKLVKLCGPKWNAGPVCCEEEQVSYLASF